MKDWQIRALKTFVQALLGVLIPSIIYALNNIESVEISFAAIFPVICSALAAGIAAVWNMILENTKKTEEPIYEEDDSD